MIFWGLTDVEAGMRLVHRNVECFQADSLSCTLFFPINMAKADPESEKLFISRLSSLIRRSVHPDSVVLYASSSPCGPLDFNERLTSRRMSYALRLLYSCMPQDCGAKICQQFQVENWDGLARSVSARFKGGDREMVLEILYGKQPDVEKKCRLKHLSGGKVWDTLQESIMSGLRYVRIVFLSESYIRPKNLPEGQTLLKASSVYPETVDRIHGPLSPVGGRKNILALKTNLLYDALLVPNVGLEYGFGKRWSVTSGWMYAWWRNDHSHRYWRIYGGDLGLRYWLSRDGNAGLKGHHVGAYAQLLTYDIEFGGRGYLGDKWSYAAGLEYGYSLPLVKDRGLNLDFSVGVGYMGGKYKEYVPKDNCYVWQATKDRQWFGPTKAEVSLVWLLRSGRKEAGR